MISKYNLENFTWIDLLSPTETEIRQIMSEYDIDYFTARDLELPTPKPRVRSYESGKYLCSVTHIPVFKHSRNEDNIQEIDFVVGRHILITARYEPVDAFNTFQKQLDVQNILNKTDSEYKHIYLHLVQEIQKTLFDELSYIEDYISKIENGIFSGKQKKMVNEISETSKTLLNFKKILKPNKEVLLFMRDKGENKFGKIFSKGADDLLKNLERLEESVNNNLEMLLELRATNDSILTTNQNEVMKILTIMAFVTFPLTLITSIFGMEIDSKPLVDEPHAFWIIMGMMGVLTICFFVFFKYKKWL